VIRRKKKELFGKKHRSKATIYLEGPGTYSMPVVGESHYQNNLGTICGKRKSREENKIVKAVLVPENDNPHDNLAVRIDIQGKTVGYLNREYAREYRLRLAQAGFHDIVATCSANIRGGWKRGNDIGRYGVWLDLPMED